MINLNGFYMQLRETAATGEMFFFSVFASVQNEEKAIIPII